jgi:signal recognition particle subunit SRP54
MGGLKGMMSMLGKGGLGGLGNALGGPDMGPQLGDMMDKMGGGLPGLAGQPNLPPGFQNFLKKK